jgi:hypothetical protein
MAELVTRRTYALVITGVQMLMLVTGRWGRPEINEDRRRCSAREHTDPLRRQFLQQHLRHFQIARVKPFRKPPVNRSEQLARLLHLALVTPETCIVEGCKFLGLDLLSAQYSSAAARNGSRGGAQADQCLTPPLSPFRQSRRGVRCWLCSNQRLWSCLCSDHPPG